MNLNLSQETSPMIWVRSTTWKSEPPTLSWTPGLSDKVSVFAVINLSWLLLPLNNFWSHTRAFCQKIWERLSPVWRCQFEDNVYLFFSLFPDRKLIRWVNGKTDSYWFTTGGCMLSGDIPEIVEEPITSLAQLLARGANPNYFPTSVQKWVKADQPTVLQDRMK